MNKILIVDDDVHMSKMLKRMLEGEGYGVSAVRGGSEAMAMLEADRPQLVLLDYLMPEMDGLEILRKIKRYHGDVGVIVITGHGSERLAIEMMNAGALQYIQKPFSKEEFLRTVRHTISSISSYRGKSSGPARIMVVDDDEAVLSFIRKALSDFGEVVTLMDPLDALNRLSQGFDILLTDVYMPKMDGMELLKRARVITPGTAVIVMTVSDDLALARRALREGASDYLKKPFSAEELKESVTDVAVRRKKEFFDKQKKKLEIQEAREAEQFENILGIVEALILALEARDPYTRGHSERVTEFSVAIATEMGLSKSELAIIRHSARLHDLGKIGTQDTHLYKQSSLTAEEREMVALHPTMGCNILSSIRLMDSYIPGIRHHHERYNGTGYPDKLKGDAIPLTARIISVADAYDAMTSTRPYREGLSVEHAVEELERNKLIQFDPLIVSAFLRHIKGIAKK